MLAGGDAFKEAPGCSCETKRIPSVPIPIDGGVLSFFGCVDNADDAADG